MGDTTRRRCGMTRLVIALAVGAAVVVATTAVALGARSATHVTTLNGTVGPGFTITLKLDGKKVSTLKAGKYKFVVSDRSPMHNFEIEKKTGGEFEKEITDVSQTGTKTVTLSLTKGKWVYYCKPHEEQMFGVFRVT